VDIAMTGPVQAALRLYGSASGSLQYVTEARGLLLGLLAVVWLTLQLVLLPMLSLTPPSSLSPTPTTAAAPVTPTPASLGLVQALCSNTGGRPAGGRKLPGRRRKLPGRRREDAPGAAPGGEKGAAGGSKVRGLGTIKAYSKFSQPANNGLTAGTVGDSEATAGGSGAEADAGGVAGLRRGHTEGSSSLGKGRGRARVAGGGVQIAAGTGDWGRGNGVPGGHRREGPGRLGARRGQRGKRSVGSVGSVGGAVEKRGTQVGGLRRQGRQWA